MSLRTESYRSQTGRWPQSGRVILAQFDAESVVVYQAYRPEIGRFAAEHGYFGGAFKLSRMTWIKPNFLWMMYRSGWGTKEGQEVVLAVRLRRSAFDSLLAQAVCSTWQPKLYPDRKDWEKAIANSTVRLQWDPDHDPSGVKLERRAIQLGLRGAAIAEYARNWILSIEDISDFVAEQRQHAESGAWDALIVPREDVYPAPDARVATRLGLNAEIL